jgi:predicted RNA-binding protein YlxR (DUF448 family)
MTAGGPARPRRVPERQCVACRTLAPRTGMLRLVRTPEGEVALDESHRRPGRGAYVCRTPQCVRQAAKRGAFQRALRRPVGPELTERIIALGDTPETTTQGSKTTS